MTTPDPKPLDGALADERAANRSTIEGLQASLYGAQQQVIADRAVIAQRDATIAEQAARATEKDRTIADLQAQLAGLRPARVLYGANLGGWADLAPAAVNAAAIRKAWPGMKAVRVWTSDASVPAPYLDAAVEVYVCELGYTTNRATVEAAVKRARPGSVLTPAHEPSNPSKGITPGAFKIFVALVGDVLVKSGRTDLTVAPVLMGGAFIPGRTAAVGGAWTDWIELPLPPGVTAMGGDLYPQEKDKGKPENLLQPVLDAAQAAGVPFIVGEYGNGKHTWTDVERADWVRKSVAFFNKHPDVFPVVLAYESSRGSGGPHNLLPRPDGTGGNPLAVEEYRKAITGI